MWLPAGWLALGEVLPELRLLAHQGAVVLRTNEQPEALLGFIKHLEKETPIELTLHLVIDKQKILRKIQRAKGALGKVLEKSLL